MLSIDILYNTVMMPNKKLTPRSVMSRPVILIAVCITALIGTYFTLGSHAANPVIISGTSFRDTNKNGVQDAGEAPIASQYIYLFDGTTGAYIRNASTDASGQYSFTDLAAGTYQVMYAPISYNDLKNDWVPTTLGNGIQPSKTVTVSTPVTVNFGWRQIVRSTDAAAPISTYTGANGIVVKSYDDVVPAKELFDRLQTGALFGNETKYVTIRFDYAKAGYTSSLGIATNGVYTDYKATSDITYAGWLNGDYELFHEYGHAWSMYNAFIVQQDQTLTNYLKARGIYGDARLNTSYAWSVGEIIAEDYRELFGPAEAQGNGQINLDIPYAKDVPGLKDYLMGAFMTGPADTTAPTTPTGLSGAPKAGAEGSQVNLTWTASTDNVGVTKYLVFRNGVQVGVINSPSTNYLDTGLSQQTSYNYAVKAVDNAGNQSPLSSAVSVKTLSNDLVAPSAPSGLATSAVTASSISLSWKPSTDNVGVTGYRVYLLTSTRKGSSSSLLGTSASASYTATGLVKGTSYTFYVVAYDASGNTSTPSAIYTAKTSR